MGCSGAATADNTTSGGDDMTNTMTTTALCGTMIQWLHRQTLANSRTRYLLVATAEMASNYALYHHELSQHTPLLRTTDEDGGIHDTPDILRTQLLSENSNVFCNPYSGVDGVGASALGMRKLLHRLVMARVEGLERKRKRLLDGDDSGLGGGDGRLVRFKSDDAEDQMVGTNITTGQTPLLPIIRSNPTK